MTNELGATGKLLEAVGKLSAQPFHLFAVDCPSTASAALAALEAEAIRTEAPCSLQTDDGQWFGGVALPVDGRQRLLYAPLGRDSGATSPRRGHILEVLRCLRQLAQERATLADESTQLIGELNRTYEDLNLFARIATQIRTLQYSEQMVRGLLRETRAAMRVDLTAVLFEAGEASDVIERSPDILRLLPAPDKLLAALRTALPKAAPAFERGCFILNNSAELPVFAGMHPTPFRALSVAVRSGPRLYGQLVLLSFNMQEIFRRGEFHLLRTMAEQLALVLANTGLYRDLELFVINLVRSFVTAIEAKDPYTKGHSERVSTLSVRIGETLQLGPEQCRNLKWASVLHDVGKIGTPESILNKPDKLTTPEYDIIKQHPTRGAEILQPISQLAGALPGIRHHHERFDGRGYPDGLAGEAIPLLGRIIAVADTYDAVTTSRAYRPGSAHANALRIIRESVGTQFDPRVVDAFESVVQSGPAAPDVSAPPNPPNSPERQS